MTILSLTHAGGGYERNWTTGGRVGTERLGSDRMRIGSDAGPHSRGYLSTCELTVKCPLYLKPLAYSDTFVYHLPDQT